VPGIQGRWEWMAPAVAALGEAYEVRTFSLNEAKAAPPGERPRRTFFEQWHETLNRLTSGAGRPVPLVGVSFGGVVALTYAAAHPERVSQLVLVSTPSPSFELDPAHARYLVRPTLSAPLFALRAVGRLAPEVRTALPSWTSRLRFALTYAGRTIRYPSSPRLMAGWVRDWRTLDLTAACRNIAMPTLLITGDPELDFVVPVRNSSDYLHLIPGSEHATLPDTGHLGFLLRPGRFAEIVKTFVDQHPSR
jgi:2-succinyl-6-hydroxy-2,4-cyclohexadiene-1-carboxylate synthase